MEGFINPTKILAQGSGPTFFTAYPDHKRTFEKVSCRGSYRPSGNNQIGKLARMLLSGASSLPTHFPIPVF